MLVDFFNSLLAEIAAHVGVHLPSLEAGRGCQCMIARSDPDWCGKVIWSVSSVLSVLFLLFAEPGRPNKLEERAEPAPRHAQRNVGLHDLTLILVLKT